MTAVVESIRDDHPWADRAPPAEPAELVISTERDEAERFGGVILLDDGVLTDEELTAQALAADPDAPVDGGSGPWIPNGTGLMPDWYMAPSLPRHRGGWRAWVAVAVVVGLVAINAAGLCITYGHLVIA